MHICQLTFRNITLAVNFVCYEDYTTTIIKASLFVKPVEHFLRSQQTIASKWVFIAGTVDCVENTWMWQRDQIKVVQKPWPVGGSKKTLFSSVKSSVQWCKIIWNFQIIFWLFEVELFSTLAQCIVYDSNIPLASLFFVEVMATYNFQFYR